MSIGKKVLSSSAILLAINLLQKSLGLVSTLIIVRLLSPEDFGIFAIALLVIQFSEVMAATGAWQYIVRAEKINDSVINSAWTFDVIVKGTVVVLLYMATPAFSAIWSNNAATKAIIFLLPAIVIRALSNPYLFVERRSLNYTNIYKISILQKMASFIVVISVALIYRSYWAMIIGDFIGALIGTLLSYHYCRYRPRLSIAHFWDQWLFSRWMLSRAYVGYFRTQTDALIISKSFSLAELGIFNIARELTVLPASLVIQPAFEPLLTFFSKFQKNIEPLREMMLTTVLGISIVVSPMSMLLFSESQSISDLLLGVQWKKAGPAIHALSPLLFVFSISGVITSLFIATGRVKSIFILDLFALIILAGILYLCRHFQFDEFIWIRTIAGIILTLILYLYAMNLISVPWIQSTYILFTAPLLAAAVMVVLNSTGFNSTKIAIIPFSIAYFSIYVICIVLLSRAVSKYSKPWHQIDRAIHEYFTNICLYIKRKFKFF